MQRFSLSGFVCLVASTAVLAFTIGCGGSGSSSTTPAGLTSSQSTAIAAQVVQNFVTTSAYMTSNLCGSFGTQSYYCAMPLVQTVACKNGGTETVTGTTPGNIDGTGTGGATITLTSVASSCAVTGTDLKISGSPSVTNTGTIFYFYGGVNNYQVNQAGTVSYGTSTSGSCTVNLNSKATFMGDARHTALTCTVTGTACGQTINQSCMP